MLRSLLALAVAGVVLVAALGDTAWAQQRQGARRRARARTAAAARRRAAATPSSLRSPSRTEAQQTGLLGRRAAREANEGRAAAPGERTARGGIRSHVRRVVTIGAIAASLAVGSLFGLAHTYDYNSGPHVSPPTVTAPLPAGGTHTSTTPLTAHPLHFSHPSNH